MSKIVKIGLVLIVLVLSNMACCGQVPASPPVAGPIATMYVAPTLAPVIAETGEPVVPTLTLEPTAEVTVEPSIEFTAVPDDYSYLQNQLAAVECYMTSFNSLGELTNLAAADPSLFYEGFWWRVETKQVASNMLHCGTLVRELNPPAAFIPTHNQLLLAADECDMVATYIIAGIDDSNINTFALAIPHMDQASIYITEATRLMDLVEL